MPTTENLTDTAPQSAKDLADLIYTCDRSKGNITKKLLKQIREFLKTHCGDTIDDQTLTELLRG